MLSNIEIGKKIEYARNLRGLTHEEIGKRVGVAKSTIQRYEKGKIKSIKTPVVQSIALALSVNPLWVIGKSDEMEIKKTKKGVVINVYGRVAAGIPIEAIEDIIDTEEISPEMARTDEHFGLQIKGDSMEPKISEGDNVIVRKQEDAESGDTVIALVNGHDAFCKRLMKYESGISLVSTNPVYEPKHYTNEEIEKLPVKILGKVVELRAKF